MGRSKSSDSRAANGPGGLSNGLIVLILVGVVAVLVIRAGRPPDDHRSISLPPLEVAGWLNADELPDEDELRGRVVLVDCWASWCGPCVKKMPQLVRFYQRYREQGLVVIGLTPESGTELPVLRSYVEGVRGLDWPIGYGAQMPFDVMGIEGLPTLVLFDKSGKSVWAGHGLDGLDDAVIAALAEES